MSSEKQKGHIEVICGCMFSGKTEELIRRLKKAELAKQKVRVFKHSLDIRYDAAKVVSHNASFIEAKPLAISKDILADVKNTEVVGIDEAQFFDGDLLQVCNQLAKDGMRVIVAGLDMNYLGEPFGPIPQLLSIAEDITKLEAVCVRCGNAAHYSHRIVKDTSLVLLGEKEHYEALCRTCFNAATT
jgi:thymidine kinase